MKKIECQISENISSCIDKLCENYNWNRAEFNRRAIEEFVNQLLITKPSFQEKVEKFLEGK